MRDLHLRFVIWLQDTVERTERNEANVEHAGNELILEWPHIIEQLHPVVAAVLGGGHG